MEHFDLVVNENNELRHLIDALSNEKLEMHREMEFLRQRNRELRQKSYINLYDENLKLIDEIKALKHENEVKFNDLVKYEKTIEQLRKELMQVGQVADKYYQDAVKINKEAKSLYEENQKLKGVIGSVQTFLDEQIIR